MSTTTGFPIGARLRHAREAHHLSLATVAERSGLSKGFLSRIERDETSPSVASLIAICDAISVPLATLFAMPRITLVRAADRPQATLPGAAVVDTLITAPHETHVTVIETIAAPGGAGGESLYALPSECEVCLILDGTVEITVDGATFCLEAGDAITFGASVPHTWRNTSQTEKARCLWVLAPALPDPRSHAAPPPISELPAGLE